MPWKCRQVLGDAWVETLIQPAIYAGVPAANIALAEAPKVIVALDAAEGAG